MTQPNASAGARHFVFSWKRGTSPRLTGPFVDEYAANRELHRLHAIDPDLMIWTLQPVPPTDQP